MSVSFEWHQASLSSAGRPILMDVAQLREFADDDSDFTESTIGVAFSDGGGGGVVYGEPTDVIEWLSSGISLAAAHLREVAEGMVQ